MRTLFYYTDARWTGRARAFAVAARGFAARDEPTCVVCVGGTLADQGFRAEGIDVLNLNVGSSVAGDAVRLRRILKERFIEAVFVHTEREHLVASSAMRLAERGSVIRRVSAGCIPSAGSSAKWANRISSSRFLFTREEDRSRSANIDRAFVAPLGVATSREKDSRMAARADLSVDAETQLVMCVVNGSDSVRLTTAMRTLALLAERHPALRLILVGKAADADDTRMHAAALGVTPLVRLLGERIDIAHVLAAADVGWVAADEDDGAFACLDFMAARVPIIADRSPLVATYVPDGIAGVLLPPADPSDTASAVARFLADAAKRTQMGNAGFTRASRDFGEQAMIDGFAAAANAAGDRAQRTAR